MAQEPGANEDLPSADQVAPPATPQAPEPQAEVPATDAPEAEADQPKTLAEAIEQALEPEDKEPEPAAAKPSEAPATDKPPEASPQTAAEPGQPPVDDGTDPSEDELRAMRPGPRRSIVRLLSQRNAARHEAEQAKTALETEKTDAASYREVVGFMQSARLEPKEVQELFSIGRALKSNDPQQLGAVLDVLMPLTVGLLELTGRAIPADLKTKVDEGEITEDLARQMSNERARARFATANLNQTQTDQRQAQQQQAVTQHTSSIQRAVAAWEQQIRQSDPDFDRKRQSLEDASYGVLARRGPPQNAEQAVAMAKEAYDRVNAQLRASRPAPTATRAAPSGQTGNRSGVQPAPKTLAEAINAALRPN